MTVAATRFPGTIGNDEGAENGERPLASRQIALERIMEGEPPPPPAMDVDRFLLRNDVNLLGGHGDAGKSSTLLHAAVCYAVGRPVFGSLQSASRGAVVLIVPEDGGAVVRHHCDAIVAGLGLDDHERELLRHRLYHIDQPINLMTDCRRLRLALDEHGVTLMIADPIASLIGNEKEDDETVATRVCDNLRRELCRPLDCTVVLAHHLRKPGRENADSAATVHDLKGSAGWANHSRQVWAVSKPKGSSLITLRLVKSNRLRTGTEHQVTLSIDADPANEAHWLSCSLVDANAGVTSQSLTPGVGRAINDNERKALVALDDRHEPGRRVSWSEWASTSGVKPDTLKGVKRRLFDAGLAEAIPSGQHRNGGKLYHYTITDRGRSALSSGWASDELEGVRVR